MWASGWVVLFIGIPFLTLCYLHSTIHGSINTNQVAIVRVKLLLLVLQG
jgi:hypothetical protein